MICPAWLFGFSIVALASSGSGVAAVADSGAASSPDRASPLPQEVRDGLDIEIVPGDRKIRIKDLAAPGKITILDYFAEWCGPCHLLSPQLERLLVAYDNLALRKVELENYESEAAVQAMYKFGMPGLPYTMIVDDRGKVLGQVFGDHIEEIEAIVRKHARPRAEDAP